MRGDLARLIDEGKTHDQIIATFVAQYGGSEEMIGAPINKGFRLLSWVLPIAIGTGAAAAIGFVAVRWSHKRDALGPDMTPATDPAFDERLDDELRNLD